MRNLISKLQNIACFYQKILVFTFLFFSCNIAGSYNLLASFEAKKIDKPYYSTVKNSVGIPNTNDTLRLKAIAGKSAQIQQPYRYLQNAKLGRGINIGNALEAPVEGTWGVTVEENFFPKIAGKGFNSVRIPINWSDQSHTALTSPYTISSQFFSRIDWVIANALKNKLSVVITMHHYNEFYASPKRYKPRFISIWDQISQHYKNYNDSLYFEVLNEPHDSIDAPLWNTIFPEILSTVRGSNPKRTVIVGSANYNDPAMVDQLVLPNDTNLILTVHDYLPFRFTHQGADWVNGSDAWLGTTWDNLESQRSYLYNILLHVKQYADSHSLPVYVGEFGAYQEGDYYSRCQWTNFMGNTMNSLGFSWAYWEFCWIFGLYDRTTATWKDKLTNALMTDPLYPAVQSEPGVNLVNGDFGQGLSPWILKVNPSALASAVVADSICKVNVSGGGSYSYDIQLTYPGLALEKGKNYTVSFKVSASGSKGITVYTAKNSDPWTNYSDYYSMTISSTPQNYSFDFTMTETLDNAARLTFDLGGSQNSINISHVKVQEQTFKVAEIIAYGTDSATAIIQNNGSLQMKAVVYPLKAKNKNVIWSVANTSGNATISNTGLLQALGTNASNGIVKAIATSLENASINGNVSITISGQGTTGLTDMKDQPEILYPNPANGDYLYVQLDDKKPHEELEVSLSDLNGKFIRKTCFFDTNLISIPVYNLTNGVYLLEIKDNGNVIRLKAVISQ